MSRLSYDLFVFELRKSILAWAADNDRIILTHDRATMPDFAYERLVKEEPMIGLFVINDRMPIRIELCSSLESVKIGISTSPKLEQ